VISLLYSTPSGIRNAVTKLKGTRLVKTRIVGSLAYRAWHTASDSVEIVAPEYHRRVFSRKCSGCGTCSSRYWRSDLENKDGWLCNNCGMNQRRAKNMLKSKSFSSDMELDYECNSVAPSAEPNHFQESHSPIEMDSEVYVSNSVIRLLRFS
jgi:hypothetical protein